ncbi:MAG: hypothetical protein J5742_04605 [Alphaproteobacteria bacterium]|nr:hypothetical protein [Alphaproteobacteria bacterium]
MSEKEFPVQHPLKNDSIDTLMKKLRMMVRTMEVFQPQATTDKALMGLHSLVAAIVSLSAEVYDAMRNNRVFVACSITCQILELYIQLLWLDKHFDTNGVDYIDFGYIEQIEMLRVHPERKDKVLEIIKQNNCERFLLKNPKTTNLLDRKNYRPHWYPGTLKTISNDCFNDIYEQIKHVPQLVNYYGGIDVNYENYQLFCGFKHFSPYMVRKCFATMRSFVEDTPEDTKWIALVTVVQNLIVICEILERHGDHILHVKPVATEGLTPASAKQKTNITQK